MESGVFLLAERSAESGITRSRRKDHSIRQKRRIAAPAPGGGCFSIHTQMFVISHKATGL
jgi:hypothetical protein